MCPALFLRSRFSVCPVSTPSSDSSYTDGGVYYFVRPPSYVPYAAVGGVRASVTIHLVMTAVSSFYRFIVFSGRAVRFLVFCFLLMILFLLLSDAFCFFLVHPLW